MPHLEVASLEQKAVYWAFTKQDRHGKPVLASPVEICVRWNVNLMQVNSPTDNAVAKKGDIVTDFDVPVQSMLWLGELEDLPVSPTNLYAVTASKGTPDIKGRDTLFEVSVMRYADKLPTVSP